MFDDEPDPQRDATDSDLLAAPSDWAANGYTLDQKLRSPRGALFETRLEASRQLRTIGNEFFARDDLGRALEVYARALWHVDFDMGYVKIEMTDEHQRDVYSVQVPVKLNSAQCLLALRTAGDPRGSLADAKRYAESAVALSDEYDLDWKAKARYWRAKAHVESGAYDDAEADLVQAAKLQPNDRHLRTAIADVRRLRRELHADQKTLFDGKLGSAESDAPRRWRCSVS